MSKTLRLSVVVSLLLAAGLAGPVRAGEEAEADPNRVEISLPDRVPLEDFLKAVRTSLDLPLAWDPKSRSLTGKEVQGFTHVAGTREEVFAAVRSLLTFYELVLIPVGSPPNETILVMDARQTAAIVKLKPKWVELTDENVDFYEHQDGVFLTAVIHTQHLGEGGLREARNALNRIVTGQNIGNVTEVPTAGVFVVTDFAPNVAAVYRLVRAMDVAPADGEDPMRPVLETVALEHADANQVADVLQASFQAPTGPRRAPQGQQGAAAVPDLRIAADRRTNRIVLHGPAAEVERAKAALAALDQPQPEATTSVQVLRLEHARAQTVAGALVQLIHGMFAPRPGQTPTPRPTVVADAQANALIVAADERMGTVIRRLVAELDRDPEADGKAPPAPPEPDPAQDENDALRRQIETKRIGFQVGGVTLPEALATWAQWTEVPLVITPLALAEIDQTQVVLAVEDRSAALVLRMLVNAGDTVRWTVADGAVVVHGANERF